MAQPLNWQGFFENLTGRLKPVVALCGKAEGRRPLGVGAGGDETYHLDRFAEEIILDALQTMHKKTGVGLKVLSEEAGEVTWGGGDLLVLVDPVDGSTNAKRGLPFYATTLAVATGPDMEDLVAGYTVNHASGEVFFAQRQPGQPPQAWLGSQPHTPPADLPADLLDLLGFEMPDHFEQVARHQALLKAFHRTRILGAMALDLCYLATGGLDAFVHPKPSRPIDFAGASLFLVASGGVLCTPEGGAVQANLADLGRGPKLMAFRTPAIRDRVLALLG